MDADEVERRLLGLLPSAPVRLVVLFGSSARGSARPDSDVDLGFLPNRDLTLGDELALQRRFEETLGRPVDLVRLDKATPMLRWRAASEGRVLFASSPVEKSRFLARAGIEHDELAGAFAEATRRFTARLARGAG